MENGVNIWESRGRKVEREAGYTVVGSDEAGVRREEFILNVRENHWRRMSR